MVPSPRRNWQGHPLALRAAGYCRSCRAPALELRSRIAELAAQKRRYGYRRIQVLLRREGWSVNHKRTYWLYREQGLMVRKRKRKRIGIAERLALPMPTAPNQSSSMDYVADGLIDGRKLRVLAIVDDYSRECLVLEVDTSLPGTRAHQRRPGSRGRLLVREARRVARGATQGCAGCRTNGEGG